MHSICGLLCNGRGRLPNEFHSDFLKLIISYILGHYRGFRFLKDNSFRVSEIYLKKATRIEALAMIMTLSLFLYSLTEFRVRKALKEQNETVPNPERRPTQKPTLKRIFFLFRAVEVQVYSWGENSQKMILGLNDLLNRILGLLGPECEKYYRLKN